MTKAKEAKFILLYGITPQEYYKREYEIFDKTYNSPLAQSNNAVRKYAFNRFREAMKKINGE